MKKVIRLTESDLVRIVKRVISEQTENPFYTFLKGKKYKMYKWKEWSKLPEYGEIKDLLEPFGYNADNVIYFKNIGYSSIPYRLVTDGKVVVFLDNSYPKKVKDSFPNPKGPFKVEEIKKYL